ncbi:MAG TPA: hypothetical protein VGS41_10595 [Chthonomonadales bacterium]|nr:hypothetical protein [Chthonomonadales bacterium]
MHKGIDYSRIKMNAVGTRHLINGAIFGIARECADEERYAALSTVALRERTNEISVFTAELHAD